MMKIIILSPFLYYPGVPHGGGALCWGQLKCLSEKNEIHFISFAKAEGEENIELVSELTSTCQSVTKVSLEVNKYKIILAQLSQTFKLEPFDATIYKSKTMMSALTKLIASVKPDAVLIQFPHMAQYVSACENLPTIMDVQDAFSVSAYRRFLSRDRWLKKALDFISWLSWVHYESFWYRKFSVTTTLTNQDSMALEIFSPGMNAITSKAAVDLPNNVWHGQGTMKIAYIGSFSHRPNVEAVLWFANKILPIILKAIPQAIFIIAGRNAPEEIRILESNSIQYVGAVPDAYEFVSSANVAVIPLMSGGGIKIKTLEAMACGCPVVATSIGAEETGAVPGIHIQVADTINKFASAVIDLLINQDLGIKLGSNARQLAQDNFSWDAKDISLNSLIQIAVERNNNMITGKT